MTEGLDRFDSGVPHSARVWNYWLGGKDNYTVDREVGDQYLEQFPQVVEVARHSRAFLGRAVRHLAGEVGIRQFLDIGTGLPTVDNTHEVAQRVAPESRIVYVDNDPLVLAHARALLNSAPGGATDYVEADVREPDTILEAAQDTLDFTKPVALMMLGILGHIHDDKEAQAILNRLLDALPSGSYLVLNDGTNVERPDPEEGGSAGYILRQPEQIAAFFADLDLLEPGVVSASRWRVEHNPFGEPPLVDAYCGVARKP